MYNSGVLFCAILALFSLQAQSSDAWSAEDIMFKYRGQYKHHEEWRWWKKIHSKSYVTYQEELERHLIWLSNRKYVEQHNANADIFGFNLAMNYWGDMTDMEYLERHNSYQKTEKKFLSNIPVYKSPSNVTYPDSLDWRTKGAVGSIKDQMAYQCGSSYAFGAMGALEGANALATGNLVSLSEQNIVDCSVPFGNLGCSGGTVYSSFMYTIANGGVDKENSYSYKGRQSECSYSSGNRGAKMSGIVRIKSGDEESLMTAVTLVGPVAVAVDASSNAFRFYSSGVFDSSRCSSSSPTHYMVITGYGTSSNKDYWLVKNSWSANWGLNGYILMTRGNYNQCGIATEAAYPTL